MRSYTFWSRAANSASCRCPARSWKCFKVTSASNGHYELPVSIRFVKGHRRGQPMTPAGLRSLFRHHRLQSQVPAANPHRFRHTFGADMVRAGISLPALQHLMGHSQIHMTLLYVQLAPQDIWREYARAVVNRVRMDAPQIP